MFLNVEQCMLIDLFVDINLFNGVFMKLCKFQKKYVSRLIELIAFYTYKQCQVKDTVKEKRKGV